MPWSDGPAMAIPWPRRRVSQCLALKPFLTRLLLMFPSRTEVRTRQASPSLPPPTVVEAEHPGPIDETLWVRPHRNAPTEGLDEASRWLSDGLRGKSTWPVFRTLEQRPSLFRSCKEQPWPGLPRNCLCRRRQAACETSVFSCPVWVFPGQEAGAALASRAQETVSHLHATTCRLFFQKKYISRRILAWRRTDHLCLRLRWTLTASPPPTEGQELVFFNH